MTTKGLLSAAILTVSLATGPAAATTMLFTFSGTPFGNTASAVGSFDIADAALTGINAGVAPAYGSVSNLMMTVSGAGSGNGVFATNSFATFFFRTPAALDFTRQLVGQSLGNGLTFGQANQAGLAGDFTFFSGVPLAPTAVTTFTLAANRGLGGRMALTSLVATTAVPEPASWALMIAGVGIVGYAVRRHRKATTRVSFG